MKMIRNIVFLVLALSMVQAEDETSCWINLGNKKQDGEAFMIYQDETITLDICKAYCWDWSTNCETTAQQSYVSLHPCSYNCEGGIEGDGVCKLYEQSSGWSIEDDAQRYNAFEACDPECFDDYKGMCVDGDLEESFQIYQGDYSLNECKELCEQWNTDCADGTCYDACYGFSLDSTGCYLHKELHDDEDLFYSDDSNAYFSKNFCWDGTLADEDDGEVNEEVATEEEEVVHVDGETEDDESTNTVVDSEGNVSCTYTEVFEECDYTGTSEVIVDAIQTLDFEPKSFCVSEKVTLTIYDEYDLEGNSADFTENESCVEDINYSFFGIQRLFANKLQNRKKAMRVGIK